MFNFVKRRIASLEARFKKAGLISKLFNFDDGTIIHCWVPEVSNTVKPTLMFVHGFGLDGLMTWADQVPLFAQTFSVYVPDLVFFGKSTTTSDQRSETFQAQSLLKVLEKEEVKEAFIVGTSYGGMVAFRMAQLNPKLVTKVVIGDSGVCMDPSSNDKTLKEFNATHISEVLMPTTVKGQKKSLQYVLHNPPPAWLIPNFLINQVSKEFGFNREQRVELLEGLVIGTPAAFPLPQLSQKVLVLWGDNDRIFELELAQKLQKHLGKNCKLILIPKAGHIPQTTNPKEFNNHVLAFLNETVA